MTRHLERDGAPRAITTTPVEPIGTREACGFVDYADGHGEFGTWTEPVHPPHPEGEALRKLRVDLYVSLREGAALLGLSARELCDVEFGRRVFLRGGFEEACARLRAGAGEGKR